MSTAYEDSAARAVHAGSLDELRELMGDCRRCVLAGTRNNLVFGVGDPHARLMFIGEAPGKNEDLKGEPFVGAAGKLLDELFAGIGLTRESVYIANILKSRPPGNRDPLPEEIDACTPFLREQVRLVDSDVIATLGNFATRFMLGRAEGITALHGKLFRVEGRLVLPIFHPAVALYDPKKRTVLEDDFKRLRTVLDRVESGELPPEGPARDDAGGAPGEASGPGTAPEPAAGDQDAHEPVQQHLDGFDAL